MAKILRGYRGQPAHGASFGSTEGEGMYIAMTKDLAEFFAGDNGRLFEVTFYAPEHALLIEEEELPLLTESDTIIEPIQAGDSTWIKLNKKAYQEATKKGVSEDNWDTDIIAKILTRLIKKAGYDSVHVFNDGEEWYVLFKPRIIDMSEL